MGYIIVKGLFQFIKSRYLLKQGESMNLRSLIPLGLAAIALGLVGLFLEYTVAFETIEATQDISPSIVASAIKEAFSYPILGFLTFSISCVFRFVNQHPFVATKQ